MNFLAVVLVIFASVKASTSATVAVVEYQPPNSDGLSRDAIIMQNLLYYTELLMSNNDKDLIKMVIFPEGTLQNNRNSSVEIIENTTPYNSDYPQFVKYLSHVAQEREIYIVVNLVEKEKCDQNTSDNCKNFGYSFYNTDVVFDSNGAIVAKYRKYNLFNENELDKPKSPEVVTFRTDFGKFGIFTCFDILFKSPAQDVLKEDVNGIIFPTMWFSQLPFLTALQTQQMWAQAHEVKLFASGANNPKVGSGGSGIYNGNGEAMVTAINAKGGSSIYTYNIPSSDPQKLETEDDIDTLSEEMDNFKLSSDNSVPNYSTVILDTLKQNFSEHICHDNIDGTQLCCDFNGNISVEQIETDKKSYTYHFVAFSGVRSFDGAYNGGIEVCGIIACLDGTLSSCGQRFPNYKDISWPITFDNIVITTSFKENENKTHYPNSLLSSIRPISAKETDWKFEIKKNNGEDICEITFSLTKPQTHILTFAIFGRNFAQDSAPDDDKDNNNDSDEDKDNNSVKLSAVSSLLLVTVIILSILATK